MKHHKWVFHYYHYLRGDPDKGYWICHACGTTVPEYHPKPKGARAYKKLGIKADCEAQVIAQVMES